ncbi:hypothetical protein WJX84_003851 [Apatococcus fuscideae]|uniref:JmjC domain-containing protein n=1 Tax=Apatococcus fuscideae TaxID=2026836 RepID=A0AAW1T0H4_9CHLO
MWAKRLQHRWRRTYASSATATIERVCVESRDQLQLDRLLQRADPAILTGSLLKNWPLLNSWTPKYVAQRFGHHQVPVEKSFGGADYRDAFQSQSDSKSPANQPKGFESNHLVPLHRLLGRPAHPQQSPDPTATLYLAQNDICEYIPEFAEAVGPEPQAMLGSRLVKRNMWLGPSGISTPLHFDPYHNLYAQAWGLKSVRLFHPAEACRLYPYPAQILKNTSQVNAEDPDLMKYPSFAHASELSGSLRPGEMLWIPKGWWHFMQAQTASLSVSFWCL